MPFNLSRRVGDAFEVHGVFVEVAEIRDGKVILKISSCQQFAVRYKDLNRPAKGDAENQAQNRADYQIRKVSRRESHQS